MSDEEEFYSKVAEGSEGGVPSAPVNARKGSRVQELPGDVVAGHKVKKANTNSMWAQSGENMFFTCDHAVERLPSGMYVCVYSDYAGYGFKAVPKVSDQLLTLPDTAGEVVINDLKHFWTRQEQFREYGFLWKRGVLLFGPPGSGKSSIVTQICDFIHTELDGLTIQAMDPGLASKCLATLRQLEPTRLIVVILEDIDDILYHRGEAEMLSLMDGETQLDNIVYLATTNYPERLDKRFVDRPSRFDVIKKIDMPSYNARRLFFQVKVPHLTAEQLEIWAKVTEGFSVAHMKEVIVSVQCLANDFDETIKRLKNMQTQKLSSDNFAEKGFGFAARDRG